VLDTETVSSFSGGDYLQWAVSGNVVIKVTPLSGNAVISGLFFDPATGAASASAIGRGTTTQDSSIGAYGNPTIIEIGTVDFGTSSNSLGVLPPNSTFAMAVAGVAQRRRPR